MHSRWRLDQPSRRGLLPLSCRRGDGAADEADGFVAIVNIVGIVTVSVLSYANRDVPIAAATWIRDRDTGGHVERIGDMSAAIAIELGWAAEDVELLRLASPMHDVGKVAISDGPA